MPIIISKLITGVAVLVRELCFYAIGQPSIKRLVGGIRTPNGISEEIIPVGIRKKVPYAATQSPV